MSSSNFPISDADLTKIASEACTTTISTATSYDHTQVSAWNTSIINTILKSLISSTTPPSSASPPYKFAVNSTIIQHLSAAGGDGEPVGRRGMHSASGAYWNSERDGMFSYKFEGAMERGFDVVVSVVWIATV